MRAYEATRLYFEHAADRVDLDERMRKLLLTPKREVQVQVAIEMDRRPARPKKRFIRYR